MGNVVNLTILNGRCGKFCELSFTFIVPYLRSKVTDCNVVGKVNTSWLSHDVTLDSQEFTFSNKRPFLTTFPNLILGVYNQSLCLKQYKDML